jgi:MEMO1 family protein
MTPKELKSFVVIIIPAVVIAAGVVLFLLYYNQATHSELAEIQNEVEESTTYHKIIDVPVEINEIVFYEAIREAAGRDKVLVDNLQGGIVTHHDLVSNLMADFFVQIKTNSNPKTFIMIGPNHPDVGLAPGISGRIDWQTPFGVLEHDYAILDELEAGRYLAYDEENLIPEHSIKVLLPFIKYYFPEAKIAPIALTSKYGLEETIEFAEVLAEYLEDPDVVLVTSIDFSHYLPASEATEMDKVTWEAMQKRDYQSISKFNNDYVDSPLSLVAVLHAMGVLSANQMTVLQHTNSDEYFSESIESTTSYFTVLFGD